MKRLSLPMKFRPDQQIEPIAGTGSEEGGKGPKISVTLSL